MSQTTKSAVRHLEEIVGRDVGRHIEALVTAARGGLWGAATSIAAAETPHVAIITGFYIPYSEPPAAENDGPPGAASLAAALVRAGVSVRLVTDEPCAPAVRAAAEAAGVGDVPLDTIPVDAGDAEIEAVLEAWDGAPNPVSHVVSIERVGPAADGRPRNARGDDISGWTGPLDRLFTAPRTTIGIGDGGNELGMGRLPPEVVADIAHGDEIACRVRCDHLIVCGVSNWGAWALIGALALVRADWHNALLSRLTMEQELEILRATVENGPSVDGMLGKPAMSVDRLPWHDHAAILASVLNTAR